MKAICNAKWGGPSISLLAAGFLLLAPTAPANAASIVTEWLDAAIPAAEYVTPEPPAAARFFAIFYSSMYEAWAAYDEKAVGTVTGALLKGTGGAATIANKREALSHAAYTALMYLAPVKRRALNAYMEELGYDPKADTPAARLGRAAANAIIGVRQFDGANQEGGYLDTSNYKYGDPKDVARWQAASVDTMNTTLYVPLTPHWGGIMPFALSAADEFRPPAPPKQGTPEFDAIVKQIIDLSANLTDEQKAIAEYWANFISSPPVHMIKLTKFVSARDDYRIDEDMKIFFMVSNAMLDSSISCWETKYHYDFARPFTVIRGMGDVEIEAWDNLNRASDSRQPSP